MVPAVEGRYASEARAGPSCREAGIGRWDRPRVLIAQLACYPPLSTRAGCFSVSCCVRVRNTEKPNCESEGLDFRPALSLTTCVTLGKTLVRPEANHYVGKLM